MRTLRLLIALVVPTVTLSCLWDRDTIREEMKGREDIRKIIVGWFDRYPPLYYEMRLAKVRESLAKNPDQISLYDDAAVAEDRLGRSTEAIEWMVKKAELLKNQSLTDHKKQHYRYLANLGTFHAHRWLEMSKAGDANDQDLLLAIRYVEQAIKQNQEAHFGREKYQLRVLKYLADTSGVGEFPPLIDRLNSSGDGEPSKRPILYMWSEGEEAEELVDGLTGIIALGAAWESPFVFDLLAQALRMDGLNAVGELATLRQQEINPTFISSGQGSILTEANRPAIVEYFAAARDAAKDRQKQRLVFLETKLNAGQHPDQTPDFWKGWSEPDFPTPSWELTSETRRAVIKILFLAAAAFILPLIIFIVGRFLHRELKKSLSD